MIDEPLKLHLQWSLEKKFNTPISILQSQPLSGGCINHCYKLKTNLGSLFLKYHKLPSIAKNQPLGMFEAEAKGLLLIEGTKEIQVPKVILYDQTASISYLVLEFIDAGDKAPLFWENFGRSLAKMHRNRAEQFGLDYQNYIGSLAQSNEHHDSWHRFFVQQRLMPQLEIAQQKQLINSASRKKFERLFLVLDEIFPKESPSLLHGDLWNGNYIINATGKACLIDPAVYYGHREMDIAMSLLFGGFQESFYDAYLEEYPLERNWKKRIAICNLYPLMVHVNLFGGAYIDQVNSILKKY